jgi:MFS family permease
MHVCFNLMAALISVPVGTFVDHVGSPKWVLLGCFLIFAIVYVGFALGTNTALLAVLFVGYGLYQGGYRAVGKSYAADLVPATRRASGLGWYATVIGLTGLVASTIGGWLWTQVTPAATFLYGATCALLASLALALLMQGTGSGTASGTGTALAPRGART